jgi:WD40 repeat protein
MLPIYDSQSQTLIEAAPVTALAIAPQGERDGDLVLLGSQAGLELRSWPGLEHAGTLSTELVHIHDLKFSPDGRTLLVAGGTPGESGIVEQWNWRERKFTRALSVHDDLVYRVGWSPDGQQWGTASADGTCQVVSFDGEFTAPRYQGHSRAVLAMLFLDDSTIVSAGVDQTIQVWNGKSGAHLRTLDNHVNTVNDLALRPPISGQTIAMLASIGEDRTVRLWQPSIGRLVRFAKLESTPRTFVWTSDGERLIVGCSDGLVRVVQADNVQVTNELPSRVGRIHELGQDTTGTVIVAGQQGFQMLRRE